MIAARRMTWTLLILASLTICAAPCRAVDPRLLPEKTEIIVKVNIKQILASELAKSKNVQDVVKEIKGLFNQIPGNDIPLKYLEKMGLDPARDLTSLTLAHPANTNSEDLFLVLEGKFNLAKIEATAREAAKDFGTALTITRHNDVTVLEINQAAGSPGVFIGLFGKETIVAAGNRDNLKEAIARSLAKKPAVLQKDVAELLKLVNDSQSISFVASSRALAGLGQAAAIGPALPAMDGGVSGSISFAKEVNFQLGVGMSDPMKLREVIDQGNLALLVGRAIVTQQAQQNAQLAPLVDVANSLRLFSVGNNAVLTGEVSYEALEQLFKSLAAQLKGQ